MRGNMSSLFYLDVYDTIPNCLPLFSRSSIPRTLSQTSSPTSNEFFTPPDDWSIVSKVAIAAMTSQGTMGGGKNYLLNR